MANLINLNAEVGANFIADDTDAGLTIENTGGGPALKVVGGIVLTSGASVQTLSVGGQILAAAATVTNLNVYGASRASGAVLALKGDAFVSAVSLIFAAGSGWAGMGAIRVVRTDGTFGWIPVLPDAQVTAAAK